MSATEDLSKANSSARFHIWVRHKIGSFKKLGARIAGHRDRRSKQVFQREDGSYDSKWLETLRAKYAGNLSVEWATVIDKIGPCYQEVEPLLNSLALPIDNDGIESHTAHRRRHRGKIMAQANELGLPLIAEHIRLSRENEQYWIDEYHALAGIYLRSARCTGTVAPLFDKGCSGAQIQFANNFKTLLAFID